MWLKKLNSISVASIYIKILQKYRVSCTIGMHDKTHCTGVKFLRYPFHSLTAYVIQTNKEVATINIDMHCDHLYPIHEMLLHHYIIINKDYCPIPM